MPAVPILAPLSRDEKLTLLDAFEEQRFTAGQSVVRQVRTVQAGVRGGVVWCGV